MMSGREDPLRNGNAHLEPFIPLTVLVDVLGCRGVSQGRIKGLAICRSTPTTYREKQPGINMIELC
jgi:hypothetical protein